MDFNNANFILIHHFKIPKIYTWGEGETQKREAIRKSALERFPAKIPSCKWYGFYIKVKRNCYERPVDIENIPKLIIDAFSEGIIKRDKSTYSNLALYPDDDLTNVRALDVEGDFCQQEPSNTEVWIYGKI